MGHPIKDSLSGLLAQSYKKGAEAKGSLVKIVYLSEIKFDPILWHGYKQRQELELELQQVVDDMIWADHWVIIHPIWWGSMPALLKGFVDRTFLPGIMYKPKLQNKTARVINTMDAPLIYYKMVIGSPAELIWKRAIFGYCGIKGIGFNYFSMVKKQFERNKEKWMKKAENLGIKDSK